MLATPWPVHRVRDWRGLLTAVEPLSALPFVPNRFFALADLRVGAPRGGHAHRAQWQAFITLTGAARLTVDDGRESLQQGLTASGPGLIVPPRRWVIVQPEADGTVVGVFASDRFDEADYVRERTAFEALVATGG